MPPRSKREPPPEPDPLAEMRREAWDPRTPAARLAQLASDHRWGEKRDQRALEGIAGNPSTSPETLAEVIGHAPQSFCRNPAISLLALAAPEWCGTLPDLSLALIMRSPRAPALLIAQARALPGEWNAEVAETAALHVTQHAEIPDSQWISEIRRYWEAAMERITEPEEHNELYGVSPADTVWELAELGFVPQTLALACPPADPLPHYTFEGFRSRAQAKEARAIDRGRKKPLRGVLEEFPEEELLYRYLGAAFSEKVAGDDLRQWAEKHAWLALAAAQHPNLPPAAQKRLAGHFHPGVRRLMLRRPDLPPELREHARRGVLKRAVRGYLQFDSTPAPKLSRFVAQLYAPDAVRRPFWRTYAYSQDWQSRLAVAVAIGARPNGQPMRARHRVLLRRLAEDGNVLVRAAARARLRGEVFHW